MTTREEAIAWLNEVGLYARSHDMWLGSALAVSRKPRYVDGIKVLDNNLIVHPVENGAWRVTRFRHGGEATGQTYTTLAAAVTAARSLVEASGDSFET